MKKKISSLVNTVYQKYLAQAEQSGIFFDIDIPDPTLTVEDTSRIESELSRAVRSGLKRAQHGRLKIKVTPAKIVVSDTGAAITKEECARLSSDSVTVTSRVGYGTRVAIKL